MAQLHIVWTKTADIQYVGVLEYWAKRNKSASYSKKLIGLVAERTKEIAQDPLLYKATNFKDIRVSVLGNYSIFYKVLNDMLIIMAFWDNRQDPKKLWDILSKTH